MTRQFGYHSDSATYPHEPSIHMIRGVGRGTGSAATMWIIVDAGSRNEDAAGRPNCVPLSLDDRVGLARAGRHSSKSFASPAVSARLHTQIGPGSARSLGHRYRISPFHESLWKGHTIHHLSSERLAWKQACICWVACMMQSVAGH